MELQRASTHPIDFLVWRATQSDAEWVVDVLRANMSRCRSLDLTLCDAQIIDFLMSKAFTSPQSLARLEYFKCHPSYTRFSAGACLTEIDLSQATSLCDIYYDLQSCRPGGEQVLLNSYGQTSILLPPSLFNRLKRVTLNDGIDKETVRRCLSTCLQLQTLHYFAEDDFENELSPIYLSQLKHLHVCCLGAIQVLQSMDAPHLEHLEIVAIEEDYGENEDGSEDEDADADAGENEDADNGSLYIGNWYNQLAKFPVLRHLTVTLSKRLLSSNALVKFLESHPNLEELSLEFRELDMAVADSLGGSTFRKLRKLSIDLPIRRPDRSLNCASVLLSMRASIIPAKSQISSDQLHPLAHLFELSIHLSRPWQTEATFEHPVDLPEIQELCAAFPGVVRPNRLRAPRNDIWSWGDGFGFGGDYE